MTPTPYRSIQLWVDQTFDLLGHPFKTKIKVEANFIGIPVNEVSPNMYDGSGFPRFAGYVSLSEGDKARHRDDLLAYARRAGVIE